MNPTPNPERSKADGSMAPGTDSSIDSAIDRATDQGRDALHRFAHQAEEFAHSGTTQLRQRGEAMRDGTLLQIRDHPLRSVLLAAGAGVALTLLIRLLIKH